MPERVATTDPDGVDFGWVMQVTFVLTIVVGAPLVTLLSTQATLPDWGSRVSFAIRVGAPIWVLTGLGVYLYARRQERADGGDEA
ncbi:MAG: DUF5822 domain-containing protein [Halolamina sp.]